MTEKEKAKAYDEAIERAKKMYGNGITEEIFPELKEDDTERIRKNCIHFLELQKQHHAATFEIKECIDWLEKQGEQKPTLPKWKYKKDNTPLLRDSIILNKYGGVAKSPSGAIVSNVWVLDYGELAKLPKEENIEPKFKVDDWIVFIKSKSVYQVEKIENYEYTLRHILGGSLCLSFSNEELIRKWTIQDAKDGDILCCESGWMCIFKSLNNHTNTFSSYCFIDSDKCFFSSGSESHTLDKKFIKAYNGEIYPATKKQRDALMKAMNDAGYEWDAEKKKKLKKKRKS